MSRTEQARRAETLRALHVAGDPLVLANVWDAGSARMVEMAGHAAVATSSAGIAYAHGYPDGERIRPAEMLEAVARIARAVNLPVTADIEAGYGDVAGTTRELIKAGAAGFNLEDMASGALVPLERQVEWIGQAVDAGQSEGVRLVVNARTDIYLGEVGDPGSRFDRTVERLRAFFKAGADCVFVPGVRDEETIAKLVKAAGGPVNILAGAGSPTISRLRELGVARVSVGSGPMRAVLALTRQIALELRERGTCEAFTKHTIPYADVNAMFEG